MLVEMGDIEIGAELDGAGIRLDAPEQQVDERGLAAAVGADDADLVAALDHGRQIVDDRFFVVAVAPGIGQVFGHDHMLAGAGGVLGNDIGGAAAFAPFGALGPHGLERAHAPFVAGAPGLDALANPDFFLGQALVEQGVGLFLVGQHLFLALDEGVVIARPGGELAAIQIDDAGGQILQEGAVMGDEQQRTVPGQQHFLELGDGRDIQMVGGLVEQQQVGFLHQRAGQQHAAFLPARQGFELPVGVQIQTRQGGFDLGRERPAVHGFDPGLGLGKGVHHVLAG